MTTDADEYDIPEEPHPFEAELWALVLRNHAFALEGIAHSETTTLVVHKVDAMDDRSRPYFRDWITKNHNEMRKAANNLALVGLVTRFHHWIIYLANLSRTEQMTGRGLVLELKGLHHKFPKVKNEIDFFEKLVTVRDSIIHADSKSTWIFKEDTKQVDPKYLTGDEVDFTEAHLKEAVDKAVYTVGWYETEVEALLPSGIIWASKK